MLYELLLDLPSLLSFPVILTPCTEVTPVVLFIVNLDRSDLLVCLCGYPSY